MPDLDEFLNAAHDRALEEAALSGDPDRFRCDTDDKAAWALRKLRDARARLARIETQATEGRRRIDEWVAQESKAPNRDIAAFEGMLRAYHEHVLATDPNRKTIRLPDGELTARKAPGAVDVVDLDAFLAWADDGHHEFLRIKAEPNKTALAGVTLKLENAEFSDLVTDDGERIPGVVVRAGRVVFKANPLG